MLRGKEKFPQYRSQFKYKNRIMLALGAKGELIDTWT